MFDIGFPELMLVAVVALLVIGPDRLPETLRTLGLWLGRIRRSFAEVKAEVEKEIGMDDIRRQLHNEQLMAEMKRIEQEVKDTARTTDDQLREATSESRTSRGASTPETGVDEPAAEDSHAAASPSPDTPVTDDSAASSERDPRD